MERLSTVFEHRENVQVNCEIPFIVDPVRKSMFKARGLADVVKSDIEICISTLS